MSGHEREVERLRAVLRANIRAAQGAIYEITATRQKLIDLYDVEHAEDGEDDFGYYVGNAARALRAASALNPTRQV